MAAPVGTHVREIMSLGLPLIGSHLAQFAIGLTDVLMLGWYDLEALAAGVLGSSVFFVFLISGSGFAWAVMPLVASSAEAGDQVMARRVTRMGFWLSWIFGVLALIPCLAAEPLLLAAGQAPDVAAQAALYLAIAGWGILPALSVMLLKSFLSALDAARVVLWATLVAVVVNAVVNYALIFGNFGAPELGVVGAAVASLAVHVVTVVALGLYAHFRLAEYALFQRLWRPDWEAFARVFRLGWPIGLTGLAEVGLFAASSVMMGWLGTLELAAHGIVLNIASATFMVHLGLSNVATIRAGRALGRRDRGDLVRGGWILCLMSLVFAMATIVVFLLFDTELVGLFTDPDDPNRTAVLALGTAYLVVAAMFQLTDGAQVLALGLLRGVQDTTMPMVHAAFGYWIVGLPMGYLLGFHFGLGGVGVWAGLAIGLALVAVLLMGRFWRQGINRIP